MCTRYRDAYNTYNINQGRLAGLVVKTGVLCYDYSYQYEDVLVGWICRLGQLGVDSNISGVYPGYSGCGLRSNNKFDVSNTIPVSINSSYTGNPYARLTCNSKQITIQDPSRVGYKFDGWLTTNGVSQVDNGTSTTFTILSSGQTITAKWIALNSNINYNSGMIN